VLASVLKLDARASDQVSDRSGHENLARLSQRTNPRRNVDGESTQVLSPHLALTSVEASANVNSECPSRLSGRLGASDGSSGTIKARQETVSCGSDLTTAKATELLPDLTIVGV
jgi:hypothetical protein